MTFFTNDTCYNLALVTVLALIILYLIGKFFSEEKFTVYFEKTAPIDYAVCVRQEDNINGINSKGNKFCNDNHIVVAKPNIKKSYLYNYSTDGNLIGYNNCVLEGGNIVKNGINKKCNIQIAGQSDLN